MKNTDSKVFFRFVFILMLAVPAAVFAAEPVGRIVYLEGAVDLQRDGELLELWDSDIGFELNNYDFIETGSDGFVELELDGFGTRGTKIKIDNCTSFYFDSGRVSGQTQQNIVMLSGSLSFKVNRLTGSEELNVRTESTIMGVRGTDFTVKRAPEGSILVTCVEGKVSCEDDRKIERFAMPGSVVEKKNGSSLSRIDIDRGDENLYSAYWTGKREEIFKAGAETFVKGYAVQYNNYLPRFLNAYEKVLSAAPVLETYGREGASGTGFSARLMSVKSEVTDEMITMRSILPLFEHAFYAVQVLEKYHSQGIGRTAIGRNSSSDDFFKEFSIEKAGMKKKLAEVRYFIKLYVNISRAASPAGTDYPSFFDDMMMGPSALGGSIPSASVPEGRLQTSPF